MGKKQFELQPQDTLVDRDRLYIKGAEALNNVI